MAESASERVCLRAGERGNLPSHPELESCCMLILVKNEDSSRNKNKFPVQATSGEILKHVKQEDTERKNMLVPMN